MNEMEMISEIVSAIESQVYSDYQVYVCVNQPDKWWNMPDKVDV